MYNHAPHHYICPLCLAVAGTENDHTMMKQADIFYRSDSVVAAINSKFVGPNPGHAVIFPTQHFEHLYDLPESVAHQIMTTAKQVALAIKKIRQSDGIMLLQNNEPASGQHAFHYHLHVFPRFENDQLLAQMDQARVSSPEERLTLAAEMKEYFDK